MCPAPPGRLLGGTGLRLLALAAVTVGVGLAAAPRAEVGVGPAVEQADAAGRAWLSGGASSVATGGSGSAESCQLEISRRSNRW